MKIHAKEVYSIESHVLDLELHKKTDMIDSFFYNCSHGIRSPIKTMDGIIQLMKVNINTDPDEWTTYLSLLKNTASRMKLIYDQFHELKSDSITPIQLQKIDFPNLLEQTKEDFKMPLAMKDIHLNFRINQKGDFFSDKARLQTIFTQLISNAITYCDLKKDKKVVSIFITSSPSSCSLQVHDNGIGISAAEKNRIFNLFFRASTQSTGAGLGLYIAKCLTEKLNGTLTFESTESNGSVFSLWIPNAYRSSKTTGASSLIIRNS